MPKLRVFLLLLALSAVSFCLSGCTEAPMPTASVLPTVVSPVGEPVDPPAPGPSEELFYVLPTPSTEAGVVWGSIVDQQTGEAPAEGAVYLGVLKEMDSGLPIVSLHRDTAPSAVPGTDGQFVLPEVAPGSYGVVLFTPDISFLIDDGDGGSLLVDVVAGETVGLGEIVVTLP